MATRIDADIEVERFGFTSDALGNRFAFPNARATRVEGTAGDASYGAARCTFSGLEGRIDPSPHSLGGSAEHPGKAEVIGGSDSLPGQELPSATQAPDAATAVHSAEPRWQAATATLEAAWLRDRHERYEVLAARIDHPHGIRLFQGPRHDGSNPLQIVAPEVSFSELRLTIKGPFSSSADASAASTVSAPTSRQRKFRFLNGLSGRLSSMLKVRLDLPVLGVRTLDQELRIPVQDGAIDFRALEESLHWLGGAFLDVAHENDQLKVGWKVPIVGPSHDLATWPLDSEAAALAGLGRVPIRSLTEPHVVSSEADADSDDKDKRNILHSLAIESIDVALSLQTPHSLELESGVIAFGDGQRPGVVDFQLAGAVSDHGPGALNGSSAGVDTSIKGLRIGALELSADRIVLEGLEQIEIRFDGFRPTGLTVLARRATATNVSLKRH